jgi:rubrerythrin
LFTKNEILDIAIQLEQNAEKVYREAASKVSHTDLASLLNWMAAEEHQHALWFAGQKEADAIPEAVTANEVFNQDFLNQMVREQSFSLKDTDFSSIQNVKQLFAVFVEFERDTILFYELLTPFVEDREAQAQLQEIIAEENRHIEHLKVQLESTASFVRVNNIIN